VTRDPYDQRVIEEFRARRGVVGRGSRELSLLLLHTTGALSGREHVTPLAYWPISEDTVAVLASNRGAARHPAWYYNLLANPTSVVEIGSDTLSVRARAASSEERRGLLARIASRSPTVAAAVRNTTREIPVILLTLLTSVEPRQ
jgi:deazaflavin-dependent oxidoreductase (nitroreductase family)